MLASFWLLGLVLGTSQTLTRPTPAAPVAVRGDMALTPRLNRGQELVYRGTFSEQAAGSRVQFQRVARFEARYFVLDAPPRGVELAALTTLQDRAAGSPTAAVLEKVSVDLAGRVSAEPGVSLTVPLEGAPAVEVGAFLELPRGRVKDGQTWEVSEPGRPVMAWRVNGNENIAGQPCLKIVGVQQADEWERPRADRPAWRRLDSVWISPRTGLAVRVERVIEQREPARRETARRATLLYDLESDLSYPARMADDRRQEIQLTFAFRDSARPLLGEPARNARPIAALQKRIAAHLDAHPPTPYREAVQVVRRQVEAAARGEVAAVVHHEAARASEKAAAVGEPAPDFVATEITGSGSGRLARWKGRAVLMVFYNPASYTAAEMLRYAQEVHAGLSAHVQVVGLSVSDDTTAVLKQRTALKLGFPILHGGGLRISYGVESTPRLVVVDPAGVIRAAYTGWGRETADEVQAELRRWLPSPGERGALAP